MNNKAYLWLNRTSALQISNNGYLNSFYSDGLVGAEEPFGCLDINNDNLPFGIEYEGEIGPSYIHSFDDDIPPLIGEIG